MFTQPALRRLLAVAMVSCAHSEPITDDGGGGSSSSGRPNRDNSTSSGPSSGVGTGGAGVGNGSGGFGGAVEEGCCVPSAAPDCTADPTVAACVCAQDDFCCTTEWDEACVGLVDELGCGDCGGGTGGGGVGGAGTGGTGSGGDFGTGGMAPLGDECCVAQGAPGCDGPEELCVCVSDPYCCFFEWDDTCVQEVDDFGCGACN